MMVLKDNKGNIIMELPLTPESYYIFETNTVWGFKSWKLQPTYKFVSETHSKDFSKPSGMVLTKA
jgi:hypothetical protein